MPPSDRKIRIIIDGDNAGLKRSAAEAEASLNRLAAAASKVGGRAGADSYLKDEIRAQKDLLGLQAARERAERASQQAKQSSLQTAREEIRLLREKQRLESQTVGATRRKTTSDDANFVRQFNTQSRIAQAEARRFQASSIQAEKQLTKQIEAEAKAQARIKINEAKRANDEQIRELKQFAAEQKRLNQSPLGSLRNTALGSFIGNVGANKKSSKFAKMIIRDLVRKIKTVAKVNCE